jgi:hypothetical protein
VPTRRPSTPATTLTASALLSHAVAHAAHIKGLAALRSQSLPLLLLLLLMPLLRSFILVPALLLLLLQVCVAPPAPHQV